MCPRVLSCPHMSAPIQQLTSVFRTSSQRMSSKRMSLMVPESETSTASAAQSPPAERSWMMSQSWKRTCAMFARVSEVMPSPRARSFQTTTRRTTMFFDSLAGGGDTVLTQTSSSLLRRKQSSTRTSWLLQMSTPSLFSRAQISFTLRTTTFLELCIATTHAGASRITIPSTRMSCELPNHMVVRACQGSVPRSRIPRPRTFTPLTPAVSISVW